MNRHSPHSSSSSSAPHFSVKGSGFCSLVSFLFRAVVIMTLVFASAQTQLDSDSDLHDTFMEIQKSVEPQVLNRLESQFLHLFGMKRRPAKRVESLKVPQYLIDIYNAQSKTEFSTSNLNLPGRHTRTANTVRTFYHKPSESAVNWGHRIKFDLSGIPEKEKVTGAELRLFFTTKLINSDVRSVRVIVNDVMRPPGGRKNKGNDEPIIFPIDSKFLDLSRRQGNGEDSESGFWLTFDVFPAVIRWTQKAKQQNREGNKNKRKDLKNEGLVIQLVHPDGRQLDFSSTIHHVRVTRATDNLKNSTRPSEQDPVLFTYSDDGVNKKGGSLKNQTGKKKGNKKKDKDLNRLENRQKKLCRKYKMRLNFEDVGWDSWIIAPTHYHAFQCVGRCKYPLSPNMNSTHHSVIQSIVNDLNPRQVPPPCCVATSYSSLSMIYHDHEGKVNFKSFKEMIVDSCGCR